MTVTMDPSLCLETVYENHTLRQCKRKPGRNGYCASHRPDLVRQRKLHGGIPQRKANCRTDLPPRISEPRCHARPLEWSVQPLNDYMSKTGLSEADIALRVGVSVETVREYRSGVEPSPYRTLVALASAIGVQTHELFREAK